VLACGSPDPTAINPTSTLNSKWKQVAYTKASPSLATAAWEGHRPTSLKAPPPMQKPPAHSHFDKVFGGLAWEEEDGNYSWGFLRPNTPPPRPTGPNLAGSTAQASTSNTGASHSSSRPGFGIAHHHPPQGAVRCPVGPDQRQPLQPHCIPNCDCLGMGSKRPGQGFQAHGFKEVDPLSLRWKYACQ
jgi:hypothetical protein